MDQIQSLNEMTNMLLRRIPVWAPIAAIGIVLSVIYALSLPRMYQTTAVIQIGSSQISERIDSGNTNPSLSQYLRKIEQRIMARDNLIQIIEKYGLFSDNPDMSDGDKVYQLRLATSIDQIVDPGQSWRPDAAPSALTVTVALGDQQLVAVVANDFVDRVLEQNHKSRVEQARRALTFFEGEERRVGGAISELDTQIAAFKRANANSLPGSLPAQHEMLASLVDANLVLDQQIIELNNSKDKFRKAEFQKQLDLVEDQRKLLFDRSATIRTAIDAGPRVEKGFNALQRLLKQLEDQYSVITKNRAEAEIGQMLETGLQSEQLSVLEKALVPDNPFSPNRKKITVIGGILSLLIAAATVLILEMLNPVIRTAAQLERKLQISPVVTIPIVKTANDRTIQRFALAAAAVLGGLGIWQFIQFVTRNTG